MTDEEIYEHHLSNCASKIPYVSRREAKHNAKRIQSKSGVRSEVYHCQVCGYFHTTSLSRFASRRARQTVKRLLTNNIQELCNGQ